MTAIQKSATDIIPQQTSTEVSQSQSLELQLEQAKIARGRVIYNFNSLRAYPLSDVEIEDWSATLLRLFPNKTPKMIQEAIDALITGRVYYDKQLGIQNIINAMSELDGSDWCKSL